METINLSGASMKSEDSVSTLVPPPSPSFQHYSRPFPPRSASQMARYETLCTQESCARSSASDSFSSDVTDEPYNDGDSDTSVDDDLTSAAEIYEEYLSMSRICNPSWRISTARELTPPSTPASTRSPMSPTFPLSPPSSIKDHSSAPCYGGSNRSSSSSSVCNNTRPISPSSSLRRSNGHRRSGPRRTQTSLETLQEQIISEQLPVFRHMMHVRHNSANNKVLPPLPSYASARPRAVTDAQRAMPARPQTSPSPEAHRRRFAADVRMTPDGYAYNYGYGFGSTMPSEFIIPPVPPPNTRSQSPVVFEMGKSVFEDDSDDETADEGNGGLSTLLAMRLKYRQTHNSHGNVGGDAGSSGDERKSFSTVRRKSTPDKDKDLEKGKEASSLRLKASRFLRLGTKKRDGADA